MGLIFLFRRLVFIQVLLGIVAFCIAERAPGVLLVAGALGALSWYVVEGPTGKPLPQYIILPGAILSVIWLIGDLFWHHGNVILAMGHFTMFLQILLLYGKKTNREYGEILVLSLMQMIGASVLTVSVIYGVFLVAYVILALFTLLLFHLKVTSDHVLEANKAAAPQDMDLPRPRAVVCRGHRWQFRTIALFTGGCCALIGTMVFLAIPRKGESQMPTNLANPMGMNKQAGFSAQVSLDGAPLSSGSREPVLYVKLFENNLQIKDADRDFLVRGASLDDYSSYTKTWSRSSGGARRDVELPLNEEGSLTLAQIDPAIPTVRAEIAMRGSNSRHLFTLADYPLVGVESVNFKSVVFSPIDQQLSANKSFHGIANYSTVFPKMYPENLGELYNSQISQTPGSIAVGSSSGRRNMSNNYAREWKDARERQQFREFALKILKEKNVKFKQNKRSFEGDRAAITAIAEYLRDNFTYELINPDTGPDAKPLTEFLFNTKSGHCEMFAAALAGMARTMGIRSRVVTGYRAGEFNEFGNYYVVRQRNAHAWTEVMLGDSRWVLFDATPPEQVAAEHMVEDSMATRMRHMYEHMEYLWVTSVVSYDPDAQHQLGSDVGKSLRSVGQTNPWIKAVVDWFRELPSRWRLDRISYTFMGIILFFIIVGMASLIHTLVVRHRRLVALQLTRLPRKQRRALARRLKWYLAMLDLLERHGYFRPSWQSPLDFSRELAEANPMRFDPVVSLTELFYEIRFGHRELDNDRSSRIKAHMRQLETALARKQTG